MYYPDLPDVHWKGGVYSIGLTGSIGAGKSEASGYFQNEGALVYYADEIAKEILHAETTKRRLLMYFGNEILDQSGNLSHRAIADLVFTNGANLALLNDLIHPEVEKKYEEVRNTLPEGSVAVFDIPLLFETHKEGAFDITIMITAPRDIRLARVRERSRWTDEDFFRREAAQMPPEEKEKRADLVILNTGDKTDLKNAIHRIYFHIVEVRR